MSKSQSFTPGKKSNSLKIINYIGYYNSNNLKNNIICNCYNENGEKFSSQQFNQNISSNIRLAQIIKNNTIGGRIFFGDSYLGTNRNVNYLGNFEGQPGGSGVPLRNKF